ncbi:uncharacterized protein LOC127047825 [Gopherus flavomarginatus]|uniref:uncharacterized protein LOC127047825 n=1 Tax=Gopherus flavomarginatus TaxID=286002 RepID=UPI0021CC3090|nr:uncharacterized protein LOC127047825 [Gopherus flavomarginatus]
MPTTKCRTQTAVLVLHPLDAGSTKSWTRYSVATPPPLQRPLWILRWLMCQLRVDRATRRKSWTRMWMETGSQRQRMTQIRDACSQELFSTLEEASQLQLSEIGEVQTEEEAPEITLGAQPLSLLLPAERLHRFRKWQRRTKKDFLHDVMMHSAAEKQELKEWQDSEKTDRKENVGMPECSHGAALKGYGVQSKHTAGDTNSSNQTALRPPSPAAAVTKLFPMHPPDTAKTLINLLAPLHSTPPPSKSSTADSH